MKAKKRSPFLLAPLAVSLLAVSIANISFAKTNQNTVIDGDGFNQNSYINNLDAGFQFQALNPDWKSVATIPNHNWVQRKEIVKRYNIRLATQLNELVKSATKQMPSRSSALVSGSNLTSPAELACQSQIDSYVQGAENHLDKMDEYGLFTFTMDRVKESIDQAREGYKRSGELALAENLFISQPSDQFNGQLFSLIDTVNALSLHEKPESQMKAREITA